MPLDDDVPRDAAPLAEDEVLRGIVRSVLAVFRTISGGHERLGVDKGAMIVLSSLRDAGQIRPSNAAATCNLDLSTVSRHLRSLEDNGLVERQPDPADGRAQLFHLTADGRALLQRVDDLRRDRLAAALSQWSATERDQLATTLARFADALVVDHARRTAGLAPPPPTPPGAPR